MINQNVDKDKALRLMETQRKMSKIYDRVLHPANFPQTALSNLELSEEVRSLKESWLSVTSNPGLIPLESFSGLENICASEVAETKKGFDAVKAFYDLINQMVFLELNNWLSDILIIEDEEFAENFFRFINETPRIKYSAVFLTNLISKLRFQTERKKFEFLMNMVKRYPNILMGEGMSHPNYVYKPSAQRTFEKCPICGGTGEPYHCAFSYRMVHFDNPYQPFKLWMQCGSCKNLYSEQFPEEFLELSTHQKEILPREDHKDDVSDIANALKLSIWSDILNKLRKYTDKKVLLEVGIGKGELLSAALEMGYEANAVEIVEESAQNISDILGIPIHCGDFLNYKPGRKFPIIIMGDVIEHVTDPEAALRNAFELLDDDGVLWLSTPNYESSFTRLKKFTDPMWLEPYHITYFNYTGLEALLNKCGFEVKEYSISNRYNGSMELIITKK